ncbi:MAG: hypothetical protein EXR76_16675 [Myxococcales bacterium]|nr:hypothetical protein [Myxococcales bacterium]
MRTTRPASPRGSALLLAVLIVLAMLGLGVIAMRSTTQVMAASGNLRLSRQARYIAEAGLYHVATVLQQNHTYLLDKKSLMRMPTLEMTHTGDVTFVDPAPEPDVRIDDDAQVQSVPPLFTVDSVGAPVPPPFGSFGTGLGLLPSYRVTVDGFEFMGDGGPGSFGDCLVELTSRGFVAPVALPDDAAATTANAEHRYSEQRMKGLVELRNVLFEHCKRLP